MVWCMIYVPFHGMLINDVICHKRSEEFELIELMNSIKGVYHYHNHVHTMVPHILLLL